MRTDGLKLSKQDLQRIASAIGEIALVIGESGGNSLRSAGRMWEIDFADQARAKGLLVDEDCSTKGKQFDVVVNGMRVQCKQRKMLSNGTVDLCLARRKGLQKESVHGKRF